MNRQTINLIPMAGEGQRFRDEGYRVPKPLVPVMGKPMVITAVNSYPQSKRWIFICNGRHLERYPIARVITEHLSDREVQIIKVDKLTEGQACTCLLAEEKIGGEHSLFISSCDYQTVYDRERYQALLDDETIDVIIWSFKNPLYVRKHPQGFAYCQVEGQRVVRVVEKRTISDRPEEDHAVVGSFFFRRAGDFMRAARSMIAGNIRVNNEFYVGTSINELIKQGMKVVVFEVERFVSFGTPFELRLFQYWESFFHYLEGFDYSMRYREHGREKW